MECIVVHQLLRYNVGPLERYQHQIILQIPFNAIQSAQWWIKSQEVQTFLVYMKQCKFCFIPVFNNVFQLNGVSMMQLIIVIVLTDIRSSLMLNKHHYIILYIYVCMASDWMSIRLPTHTELQPFQLMQYSTEGVRLYIHKSKAFCWTNCKIPA